MLIESFAREAVPPVDLDGAEPDVKGRLLASPLLAAYVVRWLELRDGEALAAWRAIAG